MSPLHVIGRQRIWHLLHIGYLRKKGYTVEHNYRDIEEKRKLTFTKVDENKYEKLSSFYYPPTDRILITTGFFLLKI